MIISQKFLKIAVGLMIMGWNGYENTHSDRVLGIKINLKSTSVQREILSEKSSQAK